MIGGSAEIQLSQTKSKQESDLDYWAIVMFGDAEKIDPLTKEIFTFQIDSMKAYISNKENIGRAQMIEITRPKVKANQDFTKGLSGLSKSKIYE